jgi:hypothetical protein
MAKPVITRALIRLAADATNRANFRDSLTGQTPQIWRGNVLRVDAGLFAGLANFLLTTDDQIIDLTASGLGSLTLEVKATLDTTAPNLMAKTVSVFDDSLTAAGWNAGTAQHATFLFSDSETNIAAGKKFLVLSGITGAGPFTYGVTEFTVLEDGTPSDAPDPETNPGSAISLEEADARYERLGEDTDNRKYGQAALGNGVTSYAIVFTTPFATPPTFLSAQVLIPSGGSLIACNPDYSTLTTDGCTIQLAAATPDGTYKIAWNALL